MLSLAVFASGGGSNLRAIQHAIEQGTLDAHVRLVLSNNSRSGALEFARAKGIDAVHHSSITTPNEEDFAQKMTALCVERGVDFIALAGYMKRVPTAVIERFRHRITNIHPALIPAFCGDGMYGMRVHEAVIASGAKYSGVTVHLVDEFYDHGPIIMQRVEEVLDGDTAESLAARLLEIEHRLYPEALQLFAERRIAIENNRSRILPRISK